MVTRLPHSTSNTRDRYGRGSKKFVRSLSQLRTSERSKKAWYGKLREPQSALASHAPYTTESLLSGEGPSEIGLNSILKTTELEIKSSLREETSQSQGNASGWEETAWV